MAELAPEIQTGGASESLYGGAVKVRRGQAHRKRVITGGGNTFSKMKEKRSRYTMVGMVAELMWGAKGADITPGVATADKRYFGGAFMLPKDVFSVKNESNCQAKKNAWASAVKAHFTTPTYVSMGNLESAQSDFAGCLYDAIVKVADEDLEPYDETDYEADQERDSAKERIEGQKVLRDLLKESGREEGSQFVSNSISFILAIMCGYEPIGEGSWSGKMEGGGVEEDSDFDVVQKGGSGFGPRMPWLGSAPASAPAVAEPALEAPLAQAQQAVALVVPPAEGAAAGAPPPGPQPAPGGVLLLATEAFRAFLAPFRACGRQVGPGIQSATTHVGAFATRVENSSPLVPTLVAGAMAGGALMPGATGAALTGVASTFRAMNSILPGAAGVATTFATQTLPAVVDVASAGLGLGVGLAGTYFAARAVSSLTSMAGRCLVGAVPVVASATVSAADALEATIAGAPGAAVGAVVSSTPAIAEGVSSAAAGAGSALAAAPSAASGMARRVGNSIRGAFQGRPSLPALPAVPSSVVEASASAVESIIDARDEASASAAAEAGAAAVGAAAAGAGAPDASAVAEQVLPGFQALAGRKRGRAEAESAAPVAEEAGAPAEAEGPAASRPRTEGGCPMCGSHGGSRHKNRKSKAKKSRKHKRRASYRKRHHSKSRSPSEEIYASPPAPVAITLPHMESSGPPVRS